MTLHRPSRPLLAAAMARLIANPLMSHMRKVAYQPINLTLGDLQNDTDKIDKANQKRLRKQQKNLRNIKPL